MATPTVLLLCDDLIFGSRIGATARAHGADVSTVKTIDAAMAVVPTKTPSCVIVDLAVAGERLAELMSTMQSLSQRPNVVTFGSHVDTARLRAATELGCDVVLPRSKFVEAMETEMPRWLAPRPK